ncbi:5'/3'-nucleotidase SurE [Fodinicola feengrottensis]|uniref:5'-nucleotidase n=2 Tax=Fodinicola feengrottensis TaxID=435914 RepID=A0ABN2IE92_9ACTN|nr:5'/3'-nucleotidase SurE [Fodinicola feengrottensis]
MARLGAFGAPPWCVLASIDLGPNTGRSILHSGTVCAALTAASLGISGLAVSIDATEPQHLHTAAGVAAKATEWLPAARKRTVVNINVPDLPAEELGGIRHARLAAFGRARRDWNAGDATVNVEPTELPLDPDTDEGLLDAGFATVTPITDVQAVADDSAAAATASTSLRA